ncbi:unnamed protein product [Urochloa humidicola]
MRPGGHQPLAAGGVHGRMECRRPWLGAQPPWTVPSSSRSGTLQLLPTLAERMDGLYGTGSSNWLSARCRASRPARTVTVLPDAGVRVALVDARRLVRVSCPRTAASSRCGCRHGPQRSLHEEAGHRLPTRPRAKVGDQRLARRRRRPLAGTKGREPDPPSAVADPTPA